LYGLIALALGVTKLVSAHSPVYWIPPGVFYGAAILECAAGLLILVGRVRAGCVTLIAICAAGGVLAVLRKDAPCGCLGRLWVLSWKEHVALASVLGMAGVGVLWWTGLEKAEARSGL
jgi:hypothetical protein